jgi:hypothetical protein
VAQMCFGEAVRSRFPQWRWTPVEHLFRDRCAWSPRMMSTLRRLPARGGGDGNRRAEQSGQSSFKLLTISTPAAIVSKSE